MSDELTDEDIRALYSECQEKARRAIELLEHLETPEHWPGRSFVQDALTILREIEAEE